MFPHNFCPFLSVVSFKLGYFLSVLYYRGRHMYSSAEDPHYFTLVCLMFSSLFLSFPFLSFSGEEASVFKCSVSRETECSRVGKQSFIITLGCNSVLLQFSSPAGTHKHPSTLTLYHVLCKSHMYRIY